MGLETGINESSTPEDLNEDWPLGEDPKSQGDDHIRNVKLVLQNFYAAVLGEGGGTLTDGAIPVHFGTTFEDSGLRIEGGTLISDIPFTSANFSLLDAFSSAQSLVPEATFDSSGDLGTFTPVMEPLVASVAQPLDTETSSSPIAFPLLQVTNTLTPAFRLKGAGTLVEHVRIKFQANDSLGAVLFSSATDAEIREGGGFTINPTGLSTFTFTTGIIAEAGNTYWVTYDRYDVGTDSIVNTGIPLKGTTIGGFFVPYFETDAHIFAYEKLILESEIVGNTAFSEESLVLQTVVNLATEQIATLTIPSAAPSGDFDIEIGFNAITNAATTISGSLFFTGVPKDLDGAGNIFIEHLATGDAPQISVHTETTHTTGADTVIVLNVTGMVNNKIVSINSNIITARRTS